MHEIDCGDVTIEREAERREPGVGDREIGHERRRYEPR
jgi:hypothetical protein